MNPTKLRDKLSPLLARKKYLDEKLTEETNALEESKQHLVHANDAHTLIQAAALQAQNEAHANVAGVVSHCLSLVFDEPYKFKVTFERKRGQTEANLSFERNGYDIDPITASGGGAVDVASFALRLACLVLSKPQKRKLVVLDEPFSRLKPPEKYGPRIVEMMETLAEKMGVQFVVVQNVDEYRAGKIVRVEK